MPSSPCLAQLYPITRSATCDCDSVNDDILVFLEPSYDVSQVIPVYTVGGSYSTRSRHKDSTRQDAGQLSLMTNSHSYYISHFCVL